jgi:hypothetical protein
MALDDRVAVVTGDTQGIGQGVDLVTRIETRRGIYGTR